MKPITGSMKCRSRRQRFTLLEMLVAMGLLAVLMLVLFKYFANIQGAWTVTLDTSELYENAHLVLDVVTRDLQSATAKAHDIPGQHIRFHQPNPQALWFVTNGEGSGDETCSWIEVGYRFQDNELQRAFVDDREAPGVPEPAWNIYGNRDDASDQDGYIAITDGVIAATFICYDEDAQATVPSQSTELPSMISIVLTLMDNKSFDRWQHLPAGDARNDLETRACRTFRKTVYLSR